MLSTVTWLMVVVLQVARTAVGPVQDVVRLALRGPPVTAQDDALAVACRQSAPLALGDRAGEPAQVQALEVGAEMDRADIGVAEQAQQFRAREQSLSGAEQTGWLSARQPSDGRCHGHDGDLRTCPALGGQVQPGAVSGMLQDLLQGVVSAADLAAGVALDPLAVHDRVGDGLEQRQGLRMQAAGQMASPVGRLVAADAHPGVQPAPRLLGELRADGLGSGSQLAREPLGIGVQRQGADRFEGGGDHLGAQAADAVHHCGAMPPAHPTRHEQVPERPQVTVQALGEADGPARRLDAAPGSALHHRR